MKTLFYHDGIVEQLQNPLGPFANFDECLNHMQSKEGYDLETAKNVCGAMKRDLEGTNEIFNTIADIKNSFSWVQESMNHRIPEMMKLYGFNPATTHLYKIIALHEINRVQQVAGLVDFPLDLLQKTVYTSIGKGLNINHDVMLKKEYRHIIGDAEVENDRQEYLVMDDDPEIFRLIKSGKITGVSIQGRPRYYLENCGHCDNGNCECRLTPTGLVLGNKSEDPLEDGIALAYVMTATDNYYGQKIEGVPPADKNTSIEIMMTGRSGKISRFDLTRWALQNKPKHQKFLQMHKSSINAGGMISINMSSEGGCPVGQKWDPVAQQCVPETQATAPPAQNAGEAQTHAPAPAGSPAGTGQPPAAGQSAGSNETDAKKVLAELEELKKIQEQVKTFMTQMETDRKNNRMSFKSLVDSNTALQSSLAKLTGEINAVKMMAGREPVKLTEDEAEMLTDEILKSTPLSELAENA